MSHPSTAKEIHLTAYPKGTPTADMFEVVDAPVRAAGEGELLTRNIWMAGDPEMRGRRNPDVKSYIPAFQLGEALSGGAVAEVIESNSPDFKPGDHVVSFTGGWREYYTGAAGEFTKVDANMAPLSLYLGVLGMPGLTAWGGLTKIINPSEGETVFVSGAAGAVGSLVCQLAKAKGCTVIGTAGGEAKVEFLKSIGVDHALNYRDYNNSAELTKALAAAAPKGVNGYFENVGGMHLEAALNVIAPKARIAVCGLIDQYNNTEMGAGPGNMTSLIGNMAMMQGFLANEYFPMMMEFMGEVAPLVAGGKITVKETVFDGLDKAPEAFLGLFSGANTGKALVKIAE